VWHDVNQTHPIGVAPIAGTGDPRPATGSVSDRVGEAADSPTRGLR